MLPSVIECVQIYVVDQQFQALLVSLSAWTMLNQHSQHWPPCFLLKPPAACLLSSKPYSYFMEFILRYFIHFVYFPLSILFFTHPGLLYPKEAYAFILLFLVTCSQKCIFVYLYSNVGMYMFLKSQPCIQLKVASCFSLIEGISIIVVNVQHGDYSQHGFSRQVVWV